MSGKRYSRILNPYWVPFFPGAIPPENAWHRIDVDLYWEELLAMDFEEELIHEIAGSRFWQITLGHMPLREEERKRFNKGFFLQSANEGRKRAIHGTTGLNRLYESNLIKAVREIQDTMFDDEKPFPPKDEDGRDWDYDRIGRAFSHLVVKGNYEAFSKIADLLKTGGSDGTSTDARPQKNNHGKAWRGFCHYVREHQTIPSKLAFKRVSGLLEGPHGDSNGNKAMRALGLTGLPQ